MASEVFAQRPYRCFLSYAHADRQIVDTIYAWLTKQCGYSIWYDAINFPSGLVASALGAAMQECQGAIIVLSSTSIASGPTRSRPIISISRSTRTANCSRRSSLIPSTGSCCRVSNGKSAAN